MRFWSAGGVWGGGRGLVMLVLSVGLELLGVVIGGMSAMFVFLALELLLHLLHCWSLGLYLGWDFQL